MRSAAGVGGCGYGHLFQRLVVEPRGALRRSQFDDVFRLPCRTLAAASEPEPEPEPEPEEPAGTTPPLRSRWGTRPKTPCDDFSVPPAGHGHRGPAPAWLAGTAVDKLRTLVGYGQPPATSSSTSSRLLHMPSRRHGRWSTAVPMRLSRCLSTNCDPGSQLPPPPEDSSTDCDPHSQLPPPPEDSLDFMSALQQRPIKTAPFKVVSEGTKGTQSFKEAVDKDHLTCKNTFEAGNVQKCFHTLEPALKVRGLLSPYSLHDKRCQGLHWAYDGIVDKVVYLTSYDLATNITCMPRLSRRCFLDFLCDERVIVTPDWDTMNTSVTHTLYDHGLRCPPHDRQLMHKGESDGSYNNKLGEAKIGVIIWRDNQVVWSEVLEKVKCKSSVEAEAVAMCLLLKRATQLCIRSLEVCTDCDVIDRVLRGEQRVNEKNSLGKLYNLLRLMTGDFDEFMSRWVPRESISFIDGLLRNNRLFRSVHDATGGTHTDTNFANSILRKWERHLNGDPIFSIKVRSSSLVNNARKQPKQAEDLQLQTHNMCYHVAGDSEEDKINALYHICRALKPSKMQIWMANQESSVRKNVRRIQDIFGSGKGQELIEEERLCILHLALAGELEGEKEKRKARICLNIILDPEILQEAHLDENSFTVVLASTEEKNAVEKLDEFSPISFVSFKSLPGNSRMTGDQVEEMSDVHGMLREDNSGEES